MVFTQKYMASPDWIKLALILAPCLTVVALAFLWSRVKMKTLETSAKARPYLTLTPMEAPRPHLAISAQPETLPDHSQGEAVRRSIPTEAATPEVRSR